MSCREAVGRPRRGACRVVASDARWRRRKSACNSECRWRRPNFRPRSAIACSSARAAPSWARARVRRSRRRRPGSSAIPAVAVTIEGHADDAGAIDHNLEMSRRRAEAVRRRLIESGVAPERIRTVAYGRERPIAECGEPRCAAQNRRAVTVVGAPAAASIAGRQGGAEPRDTRAPDARPAASIERALRAGVLVPSATGKREVRPHDRDHTRCRLCVVAVLARRWARSPRRSSRQPGQPPRASAACCDRAQGRRAAARGCPGGRCGAASAHRAARGAAGRHAGRDRDAGIAGAWRDGARRRQPGRQMPGPAAAIGAADAGRLDGIETQIRALAAQLEQVQEQVRALAAGAGPQPQAANDPPGAAPRPGRPQIDASPAQPERTGFGSRDGVARCQEGRDRPHPQRPAAGQRAARAACRRRRRNPARRPRPT